MLQLVEVCLHWFEHTSIQGLNDISHVTREDNNFNSQGLGFLQVLKSEVGARSIKKQQYLLEPVLLRVRVADKDLCQPLHENVG